MRPAAPCNRLRAAPTRARQLLHLAGMLIATGCDSGAVTDAAAPRLAEEVGSYLLVALNEAPLPGVVLAEGPDTVILFDALLRLNPDRTFLYETLIHDNRFMPGPATVQSGGRYGRADPVLWLQWPGDILAGPVDSLSYDDGVLTYASTQVTYRFERVDKVLPGGPSP